MRLNFWLQSSSNFENRSISSEVSVLSFSFQRFVLRLSLFSIQIGEIHAMCLRFQISVCLYIYMLSSQLKKNPHYLRSWIGPLLDDRLNENVRKKRKPWKGVLCFQNRVCLSPSYRANLLTYFLDWMILWIFLVPPPLPLSLSLYLLEAT